MFKKLIFILIILISGCSSVDISDDDSVIFCTEIGCEDTYYVYVDLAVPKDNIIIEIDGEEVYSSCSSQNNVASFSENLLESETYIYVSKNIFYESDILKDDISILIKSVDTCENSLEETIIYDAILDVSAGEFSPNGEECPPTCEVISAS